MRLARACFQPLQIKTNARRTVTHTLSILNTKWVDDRERRFDMNKGVANTPVPHARLHRSVPCYLRRLQLNVLERFTRIQRMTQKELPQEVCSHLILATKCAVVVGLSRVLVRAYLVKEDLSILFRERHLSTPTSLGKYSNE